MDVDQTRARGGNRTCYNCGKEGHFKAQCPEPRKAQRAQNTELSYGENDEYIRVVHEEMRKRGINRIGLLLDNGQSGFAMDGQ